MNTARNVAHLARYEFKSLYRDPEALVFTIVLPVVVFFFLVSIVGTQTSDFHSRSAAARYYLPFVLALGITSATFFNTAVRVTSLRESGVLKRMRGTPASPFSIVAAWFWTAALTSIGLIVALILLADLAYGVSIPAREIPFCLLSVLVADVTLTALGFALTIPLRSDAAALPVANAIVLPLYLASGLLVPVDRSAAWIRDIGDAFPLRHIAKAFGHAFDPATSGSAFGHLGITLAWGLAGLLISGVAFRWTPVTSFGSTG